MEGFLQILDDVDARLERPRRHGLTEIRSPFYSAMARPFLEVIPSSTSKTTPKEIRLDLSVSVCLLVALLLYHGPSCHPAKNTKKLME